jgi:hypothetical protein
VGTQKLESGLGQPELVGIVGPLLVAPDQEAIDESLNSNISLALTIVCTNWQPTE